MNFNVDAFRKTKQTINNASSSSDPPAAPITTDAASQARIPFEEQILNATSSMKLLYATPSMKLVSLEWLTESDWKDLKPGKRPVCNLTERTDEEIVELGAKVFREIQTRISGQTIGGLYLLAYNLKDKRGARVFAEVPSDLIENAIEIEELRGISDRTIIPTATMTVQIPQSDPQFTTKLARAYSYLACSYMTLHTKSAESYTNSCRHLRTRFESFFNFRFPFADYLPALDAVRFIKRLMELHEKFKSTFYNLLYAGEAAEAGVDLKNFLYRTHVSFTGLLAYKLYARAMDAYNVSKKQLAVAVYQRAFDRELRAIAHIFNNLEGSSLSEYKLQMWKYARIFDPDFLSALQTKSCQLFVLMLAHLLRFVAPEADPDVFKMPQIVNAGERIKEDAKKIATNAYAKLTVNKGD